MNMNPKKQQLIDEFDPNSLGTGDNLFGLPFDESTAEVVVVPVPWDVTVSYNDGTIDGPQAVLEASFQVDLFQRDIPDAWKLGITIAKENSEWRRKAENLRNKAVKYIDMLAEQDDDPEMDIIRNEIDRAGDQLKQELKAQCAKLLDKDKLVVLLGGDHSTPLGYYHALAEKHQSFGVLQIDAHADLRQAYEGFKYSHASIMFNALEELPQITKMVQVGIRDYCEEEFDYMQANKERISVFFDEDIRKARYGGANFDQICDQIIAQLPQKVHITFDIDGLDPKLCPNTGTPVPGGFEFDEVMHLIKKVVLAGKQIIGFDLVEVAPGEDEWDGNVGARALYRIINLMGTSNKLLQLS
jgi:agmatinase